MQAQQLAVLFGLAGAAFSLSMVLPQAALIWRDRSYAGVHQVDHCQECKNKQKAFLYEAF